MQESAQTSIVTIYQYGELLILLEQTKPGDNHLTLEDLAELIPALSAAGVPVNPQEPIFGEPAVFAMGASTYLLQGFNVGERSEGRDNAAGIVVGTINETELLNAITVVADAVKAFGNYADRIETARFRIDSVQPNWRLGPQSVWDGGGGPAGTPIAGVAKYFRPGKRIDPSGVATYTGNPMHVQAEYNRMLAGAGTAMPRPDLPGTGVRIAIIDSWPIDPNPPAGVPPHVSKIEQFVRTKKISAVNNPLLFQASRDKLIDAFKDYRPASGSAFPLIWPKMDFGQSYDMSDHGLFIAGMIRDIAPGATISVHRVLNDQGGGASSMTVFRAVADALAAAQQARENLVINMSLSLLVPVRVIQAFLAFPRFFSKGPNYMALLASTSNQGPWFIDTVALHVDGLVDLDPVTLEITGWKGPLATTQTLFDRMPGTVLPVAAAGNESERPNRDFAPSVPAVLMNVLSISGTEPAGGPSASFSNRDALDVSRREGISARSGARVYSLGADTYESSVGIQGLAVTPVLPPPLNPPPGHPTPPSRINNSGWCTWSGTSFGTAIATGLAACIWAENLVWDRRQVIAELAHTRSNHMIMLDQH